MNAEGCLYKTMKYNKMSKIQIIPSPEIKIEQGRKLLTQWLAVPVIHQLGFLMSYALS